MPTADDIPLLAPPRRLDAAADLRSVVAAVAAHLAPGPQTVIVNDPQRHTDSAAVLHALADAGRCDDLRILVAAGTHRFEASARADFERRLAGQIPQRVGEFAWHDCRSADLEWVSLGGPWRAHPWLLEGDRPLLAVGSVEPHYFAGLTGAHKTATIGCAAFDDIQANHAGALAAESRPFALEGNPVYDGVAAMLRALEARRGVQAVNLIQAGETILACAGGEPLSAVHALADPARQAFCRTIDGPADALVLDVAGPLDQSFYQADKAIKNNENAVRDGGLLVLCAACPAGIGQDHFIALLAQAADYAAALAVMAGRGYRLGDHKAVKLRRLTDPAQRGVRVAVVSEGLTAEHCRTLGFAKADSVDAALDAAGLSPARHRIFRVGDAGNTVVLVQS